MDNFRQIVNDCIRIGLEANVTSMKRLCSLSYGQLRKRYQPNRLPSRYYLPAISKAAGILASRKKSIKRGIPTKDPYLKKPLLVSCYSFKITKEGTLRFSLGTNKTINITLNKHILDVISAEEIEVRSFTINFESLSLAVRKEVTNYIPNSFFGIDRNASNLTYGNSNHAVQFNLKKVESIVRTTRQIIRSFKRNDTRIRKNLSAKYGGRRSERVKQILHHVSKTVVANAKERQAAIIFEDIEGFRNLYRKGNFQGKNFRARMNSVPWNEIKRQIEYKAVWEGVPIIQLTNGETRGTSKSCPVCGERLQEDRYSKVHRRELWCRKCRKWRDRDQIAVMNLSYRGWLRFRQSKGEAREAMVQEPRKEGALLKVDASKLSQCSRVLALASPNEDLTEPHVCE
jgi:putative transposase